MKRTIGLLLTLLLVSTAVFGSGSGEAPAGKKLVLRWATNHSEAQTDTKMMVQVADKINAQTQGRLEIQIFPNGVLGSYNDMAVAIQNGMVDMLCTTAGYFIDEVPWAGIIEAPYIFRDSEHMDKALNGPIGEKFNQDMLKKNVRILGFNYYGVRHVTTSNKPIYSVKDMQGLKLRVPENKLSLAMAQSWGANPTPIAYNDLYMALSTHVVDGQENPLPTIWGQKYYENQKYIILTGHTVGHNMYAINEDKWKQISPGDQKIIKDALAEGYAWNDKEILKSEAELIDQLKQQGCTIIEPDTESFRAACAPALLKEFESVWGKGTWESIQAIK
jgi:tripartite ATP-independent transporter DctP family solute receptor